MLDMSTPFLRTVSVAVLVLFSVTGCGSSTPPPTASEHLDSAYVSYMSGNMVAALDEVDSSIAAEPLRDAGLLRPQFQFAMQEPAVAFASLDAFASQYPNDAGDEVLRAEFLVEGSGSCAEILTNLGAAATEAYGGLTCETFWEMVEGYGGFAYFRDSCPAEYALLESSKVACPAEVEADGARGCKQNINKFVYDKPLGPELWLNHEAVWKIDTTASFVAILVGMMPVSMARVVAAGIKLESWRVKKEDNKNLCGAVVHWTWLNFNPAWGTMGVHAFWATAQN
jgi:hypothetical protein